MKEKEKIPCIFYDSLNNNCICKYQCKNQNKENDMLCLIKGVFEK